MESLKSFQILLVLFFLLTSGVFAQTTVQVSEPTGGFSIDGDLRANFPAPSGVGDWFPGLTGSGGHVFTANGNVAVPVNISTTFYFKDEIRAITTPGTGNIFSSSKFDQNPNDWSWTTGNVQPKNDLGNVYLHIGTDEVTKDQWIFVGADRLATNGNAYVDFEFLQNEITPVAGGTFSADGPDGGRTVGDFLIAVEFASTPNVDFYTWEPDGNGGFAWKLNTPGPLAIAARSINGTIDPLNTYGAPYKAEQFVEAAVDFTALLNVVGDACAGVSIGNIFIKSRASGSSDQSSLADFVESIPVQIELGTATISYNSDDFCGDSALPTISGIQEGEFFISEQGVGNTGTITIDPATGEIDLTSAGPGDTYKIGYQYFSVGGNQCEKFAYFDIVLPLQVPSPAPASFDFCVGSGANQLQAISVAPFSSDYQINWFDSNMDPLQGAPSISTASAGVYTYYVSQSKIDGTECESEMAEITVNVGVCSLTLVKEATNGPTGEDCLDPTLNPTIDYSFTLTNNGAYPLTNIQISDPLFEAPNPVVALTLSDDGNGDAELGVGETWIYTASYTITATDIENGQVENQATASGDANGFTVSDLSGTAVDNDTPTVVSVCQNYELTLDKQVKSGDPYSAVGNVVVYDYVITNSGNVTLDGPFSVSDDKIAGIADVNGPLAPGASVTATGSYTISQTDIDAGFVTNIATASGNGVVSNSDTETVNATQTPSIEIVKSATPSTYNAAGDVITYTFDVSNTAT
ncbi:hypothetical protein V8V91_17680 [Algoriphagus halophilus]|uniref:DUF7507 domain-containing protein n=1 Tax=Algoriphagus halophilus TaxID=226505 RepID=UPI00358F2329